MNYRMESWENLLEILEKVNWPNTYVKINIEKIILLSHEKNDKFV